MEGLPSLSSVLGKVPFCVNCKCSGQISTLLTKTRSFCFTQPLLWGHAGNATAVGSVIPVTGSKLDSDQCGFELVQGKHAKLDPD